MCLINEMSSIRDKMMANHYFYSGRYLLIVCLCSISLIIFHCKFGKLQHQISPDEGYFWVFSDSHVDVLYRDDGDPSIPSRCQNKQINDKGKFLRKFGHYNCDSPTALLMSALSAAKRIYSNVEFIIWLGDATSHTSSTKDTIIEVNLNFTQEIRKYFPRTLIIPVLGNHDILLSSNRSTRFIEFYHKTKYNLLLNDQNALRTFLKGGYYSIRYPTLKRNRNITLRFVVLNSAMFQTGYSTHFDLHEINEQIEWFNKTMFDAHGLHDRVLLLTHSPFGINEDLLYRFYDLEYEQKLLAIIERYSSNIIICLSAHRHLDIFRVYSSSNVTLGILGQPSISPISYLSEPSIRKYSYDKNLLILTDYEQYSLDLIESERTQKDLWKYSYEFSSWYNQKREITSKSLLELAHLIRNETFYLKRFLFNRNSPKKFKLTNHHINQILCALTTINFDEFISCTTMLKNKNLQYNRLIINNSSDMNIHINERLNQ